MSKAFVFALGLVGLSALGAASVADAAPVPASVAAIGNVAPHTATSVQYRRWGGYGYRGRYWGYRPYWRYRAAPYWGWGAAGVAAGVAAGAAIATAPYYYGPPAYYAPAPAPGPTRQCWISTDSTRGYGYWRPC